MLLRKSLIPHLNKNDGAGSGDPQPDDNGKEDMPEWAKRLQAQVEEMQAKLSTNETPSSGVHQIPVPKPPKVEPKNPEDSLKSSSSEPKQKKQRGFLDWLL